ncbi:Scavenger receptor cysteine-rich type 1 protein, partial [Ophiophagus hannah]
MNFGPWPGYRKKDQKPGLCIPPALLTLPTLAPFFFLLLTAGSTGAAPITIPEVRLVNGRTRCQGRVEIFYNNTWGTVCDDDWDIVDANVVCRQLGCSHAIGMPPALSFGRGQGPIFLDNVDCKGREAALKLLPTQSAKDPASKTTISSLKDKKRLGTTTTIMPITTLVVEDYKESFTDTVTVCDDDWDYPNAQVVCRQLGCGAAIGATVLGYFGYGSGPILLDNVDCIGTETELTDCFNLGWGQHNCGHHEDAGVLCRGFLRLVNGSHRCEGRVEMFYLSQWGTVCDDAWDLKDVKVVCRQLGCGGALAAFGEAQYGQGKGHIFLDNLKCKGDETSLLRCSHIRWNVHNCDHSEDAGALCHLL